MEGTCDRCKGVLSTGGILFTPPGENEASQNLCMSCFESMSGTDVQPEKAA